MHNPQRPSLGEIKLDKSVVLIDVRIEKLASTRLARTSEKLTSLPLQPESTLWFSIIHSVKLWPQDLQQPRTTTFDAPNMDSMLDYEIVNFQCGVTANTELTILCYGKRFHIQIFAENLHGNLQLEKEYLKDYKSLKSTMG
jgi:hypothetical protein